MPASHPLRAPAPISPALLNGHPALAMLLGLLTVCVFASTALTNLMALVVSLVALWVWAQYRPWGLLREPLAWISLALLGWVLVRDLMAGAGPGAALEQVGSLRVLLFLVLWAPLFMAVRHRQAVVLAFAGCMCAFVLAGTLPSVVPGLLPVNHYYPGTADVAGPMLTLAIVACFWLFAHPQALHNWHQKPLGEARARKQFHPGWRWALLVLAMMGLFTLLWVSGRRTGFVTLLAAFAVWAALFSRRLGWKAALTGLTGAILLTGGIWASPDARHRMHLVATEVQTYFDTQQQQRGMLNTSSGLRLRFWSTTVDVIGDAPLLGVGLSQFPAQFMAHTERRGGALSDHGSGNPHNEYLYMWAGLGLPGLLLYLALLGRMAWLALQAKEPTRQLLLAVAVAAFASSVLFNSMLIDMKAGHFFLLTALVLAWFPRQDAAHT